LEEQEGRFGFGPAQGANEPFKEAPAFRQRNLLVVEEAHRPQHQHEAVGRQGAGQMLLGQPGQLVAGEGPGHLDPA
jgi:hypothetical protein